MSDCRRASFQSGVEIVYSSQAPSGLGAGEPAFRISCMSRNVMGRFSPACALAGNGLSQATLASVAMASATRSVRVWNDRVLRMEASSFGFIGSCRRSGLPW